MMRLSCLIAVIALAACPGSKSSPATTETKPVAAADDRCPMTIDGTSVAVEDTATGGALVFVTTGDLDALRLRLRGWATRHSQRHEAMGPLPIGDEVATGGASTATAIPAGTSTPTAPSLAARPRPSSRPTASTSDHGAPSSRATTYVTSRVATAVYGIAIVAGVSVLVW